MDKNRQNGLSRPGMIVPDGPQAGIVIRKMGTTLSGGAEDRAGGNRVVTRPGNFRRFFFSPTVRIPFIIRVEVVALAASRATRSVAIDRLSAVVDAAGPVTKIAKHSATIRRIVMSLAGDVHRHAATRNDHTGRPEGKLGDC
jgi:hypothetical protein